jgi:uncharacterized protein YcbX
MIDAKSAIPEPSPVGTVAEIWRYPVKSMHGERLDRADLRWTGIAGDRQFAFVRSANRARFPWLTGRDLSELVLYRAHYADPANPRESAIRITAPDGQAFDIWDTALARRLGEGAEEPVHPMQLGRGAFDQHPVSVITTATLRRLSERAGREIDPRRFRINIVIAEAPDAPPETDWAGRALRFGETTALRVDEMASRCIMVTLDPDSALRDPKVMRVVAQDFDNKVGCYCVPTAVGGISVGDAVFLR